MRRVKKIVVDSSVIVKWLNSQDEDLLDKADKLLKDCQKKVIALFAPELAKYEVGNAILSKGMNLAQTKSSLSTLYSLPLTFVSLNEDKALDTVDISTTLKITYYDGVFLNLSQSIKGTLVTDNPKHQKISEGVRVISLRDYK